MIFFDSESYAEWVGVDVSRTVKKPIKLPPANRVSVREIQDAVCLHFSLSRNDLIGKRHNRKEAWPRFVAFWLCRNLTTNSYPSIGRLFGGRDHTGVMRGVSLVDGWIEDKAGLGADAIKLKKRLGSGK